MITTKVIQNGNNQIIEIPKEIQSADTELIIKKIGDGYILYPADDPWYPLEHMVGDFSDFPEDREQPSWDEVSEREPF